MTVEVREIAERVLFGPTLADKLFWPGAVSDRAPGIARATPPEPARDGALRLCDRAREQNPFPADGALRSPHARADVLHAFANHELLAIELMATMLVRFPDAPPRLRLSLLATLRDEQRHLALYLKRLEDCGLAFGERPLSAFFWNALAGVSDLRSFLSGMSLGFEQANLDFSRHYQGVFARVGDQETAMVLKRVHDDEIRHVRQGARWLMRLDQGEGEASPSTKKSLGTVWRQWLPQGLHPAFARGKGFDREGRVRAGLGVEFIDAVERSGAQRGRPAELFFLNADCEGELIRNGGAKAVVRELEADLMLVAGYLASRTDAVVVREEVPPAFVASLALVGLELPERVVLDTSLSEPEALVAAWRDRPHRGLRPWGATPRTAALGGAIEPRRRGDPTVSGLDVFLRVASKAFSVRVAHAVGATIPDAAPSAQVVTEEDRFVAAAEEARERGFESSLAKALFSSAGRGHRRVDGAPDAADLAWFRQRKKEHGGVTVEPWLRRVMDLSFHFTVEASGGGRVDGVTRFATTPRGGFLGTFLSPPFHGADRRLLRWISEEHGGVKHVAKQVMGPVTRALHEKGYFGPASVDALVYEGPTGFALRPVVEVNPRATMGRVGLSLRDAVAPRTTAVWLHLTRSALRKGGFDTFAEFAEWLPPPRVTSGRLVDGVIFTTPPKRVTHVVTLIVAGAAVRRLAARIPALAACSPGPDSGSS